MELALQFGYGMMEHCRQLLRSWNGGTVVLSPRDLNNAQLHRLASDVTSIEGGGVLLDPQFYLPQADHDRLLSHDYWPEEFASDAFFSGPGLTELLTTLLGLNHSLGTQAMVLPGMLSTHADDVWLARHEAFLHAARELAGDLPVWATLALDSDTLRSRERVTAILDAVSRWEPDAFYLVCEHPNGDYLVDDPLWLAHVLDLVAGLRLAGSNVVIGYCNHQMLISEVACANAICSGTWMNVRSFPPDKFRSSYEDEIRRRTTWYYSPQALSEYKIPFLDVAHESGILDLLQPDDTTNGGYADQLFSGVQPTTTGFTEQAAFRHYLHALRAQAMAASDASSYDEALEQHRQLLDQADSLLGTLVANGVTGQNRDFGECIEVNRSALTLFDRIRGPMLRRRWGELRSA
ncbi:MAG: hypothetical protein KDC87_05690 [Planctomycetes bacterium]|nr:hypothetical protein [Planctomycetota bacterium]